MDTAEVFVFVLNQNDNVPVFGAGSVNQTVVVGEDAAPGAVVATVHATDKDKVTKIKIRGSVKQTVVVG